MPASAAPPPAAFTGRPLPPASPCGRCRLEASHALVASALALLHVTLALLVFDPTPFTGGDNAGYVGLARSLLERGAYLDLYLPGSPPHTQYPPVLPLLLTVPLALDFDSWAALKLVMVGFSAAAVALSYLWLRSWMGSAQVAAAVAVVLAVAPGVLRQSHWVLSDVPFWAFTMLALLSFEGLRPGDDRRFALATVAVLLAYFTRSAGLPLLIAAGAWLGWRRHWRWLAALALAVAPLALIWWLRSRAHGGVDYVQQFWWIDPYQPELGRAGPADLLTRVTENYRAYLRSHLPALWLGLSGRLPFWGALALVLLAIVGWVSRLRRASVPEIFLPLYVGLLLVWPAVWSGERFLLPVLPLLFGYAALALRVGLAPLPKAAAAAAGAILVLAAVAAAAPALRAQAALGLHCQAEYRAGDPYPCLPPGWREYFMAAEWAGRELPRQAVVLSRKPRLFYALSGLRGDFYPLSADPDAFFAHADSLGAQYLVVDQMDELAAFYLAPVVEARAQAFCVLRVLRGGRTVVFGILPPADRAPAARLEAGESRRLPDCPAGYSSSSER